MNLNDVIKDLPDSQPCTNCKGTGKRNAIVSEGRVIVAERECYSCKGSGQFPKPDLNAIYAALQGRKGIRTAKPKNDLRAAYVWRMYRFHGGIDVTLPIMFTLSIGGDPYEKLLDEFASALARQFRGTDKAAAVRWGLALGFVTQAQVDAVAEKESLPATAFPLGPEKDKG